MKIRIYFASRHGQTRRVVEFLARTFGDLGVEAVIIDLGTRSGQSRVIPELDAVLVGAPVYQERYPAVVRGFVRKHRRELFNCKRTGFFPVCLSATPGTPNSDRESLGPVRNFLDDCAWTPLWLAVFPGALNYREYSPVVRWIMKRITMRAGGPGDTTRDYEFTRWDEVSRFARRFRKR